MSHLFRMKPFHRPKVWAGERLGRHLGRGGEPGERIGESLEASGLADMPSRVVGGEFAGRTLEDVFEQDRARFLGASGTATRFPLLVKRIDAGDRLSVQVHPDDHDARRLDDEPNGKTEAWVILEADEGAAVHLGFKEGVAPSDVAPAVADGTILDLMQEVPVAAGDVIPVYPGTIHAIGGGIFLFEVQQPSDLTYRLYDHGRHGQRILHVDKGLQALGQRGPGRKAEPGPTTGVDGGTSRVLCDMGPFRIERWSTQDAVIASPGSLRVVHVVGGTGAAECGDDPPETLDRGDTLVVPATAPTLTLRGGDLDVLVAVYEG